MGDALAVESGRKLVKEGFRTILLDRRRRSTAVRLFKAVRGHKRAEHSLLVTQFIRPDVQAIEQAKVFMLSLMTNTPTATVRMNCSFLSITGAVLKLRGGVWAAIRLLSCWGLYGRHCWQHDAVAISAQAALLVLRPLRAIWSPDDEKCQCFVAAWTTEWRSEGLKRTGYIEFTQVCVTCHSSPLRVPARRSSRSLH